MGEKRKRRFHRIVTFLLLLSLLLAYIPQQSFVVSAAGDVTDEGWLLYDAQNNLIASRSMADGFIAEEISLPPGIYYLEYYVDFAYGIGGTGFLGFNISSSTNNLTRIGFDYCKIDLGRNETCDITVNGSIYYYKKQPDGTFGGPQFTITPSYSPLTLKGMDVSVGLQIDNVTMPNAVSYELKLEKEDGTAEVINSNSSWGYTINFKGPENTTISKAPGDSSITGSFPTTVGDYVAETEVYTEDASGNKTIYGTASTTFSIKKREGSGSITVPDIRYGVGNVTPQVSSDTNGTNHVTVSYKVQGADDSTYTTTLPTIPGKYTARAVFEATDTTEECSATTDFEILKAFGTAQLAMANVYYGEVITPSVSASVTGVGTPEITYKLQNADNGSYAATVPTAVGSYTVRAYYAESACYFGFSATADFTISYMPAPEYTVTGTKGTDDFYTSAITITPAAGYEVATQLDGDYAAQVSITNIGETPKVYFRNAQTGAKSDGVSLENIKIDASAPLITDAPEEEEVFEDTWNLTVSDLNLSQILVNGEPVSFTGSSAQITFDAEGGRREYHIEIVDRAGNVTEYDFVLSAKWLQEGIIPVGEPIVLEPDTPYVLSEGENVTIEGDATQYAGGMTVYVREAGQFTFN
ncbi:MAG: hypothetical protein ACI4DU_11360 [Lachnospiraceae bacterium]